jgi:flagellar FliL protein
MSNETNAPAAPAAPPTKSRRGLFIVLFVVLLLLAGGGGGAYWFLFRAAPEAEAAEAEAEPEPPPPTGIIPLEPFVVNLADAGGSRFLRVSLSLVVGDEAQAKEFEEDKIAHMRVRSAILELLAQKQAAELVTPDGKSQLKKSIAEGVSHAAHELKVADVLFSEFIVQY